MVQEIKRGSYAGADTDEILKSRGLTSIFLRSFAVARINPIRFWPKDAEPLSFNQTLEQMNKTLAKFNPAKIKMEDLARTGGINNHTTVPL